MPDAHAPRRQRRGELLSFSASVRRSAIAPFECDRWEEVEVSDGSYCGQNGGLVPRNPGRRSQRAQTAAGKVPGGHPPPGLPGRLPSGTPVLVRGDVDAKPGPKVGDGDIRLRSMKDTLDYGRQKGWKQVIFGHIGREPEKSLAKVRARLGEILGCEVAFIDDWLDPATATIKDEVARAIRTAAPGSVHHAGEHAEVRHRAACSGRPSRPTARSWPTSWPSWPTSSPQKVAKVYVHEAFSAGSLDASSVVVPAAMERVALGKYEAEQFDGQLQDCLAAQMVIFSGLKADKLDDMEAMINRGKIRLVISAGSLAMALKKAAAELEGKRFQPGPVRRPGPQRQALLHSPQPHRAGQDECSPKGGPRGSSSCCRSISCCRTARFPRRSGRATSSSTSAPPRSKLFADTVSRFIERPQGDKPPAVVFHNGVFGMFEDPRFEEGTRKFVAQLKRMKDAGIKVYIGGGEGGTSLEKYGQPDWVTYVFTAGGTVLNALGSEPVPYLVALKMAAGK